MACLHREAQQQKVRLLQQLRSHDSEDDELRVCCAWCSCHVHSGVRRFCRISNTSVPNCMVQTGTNGAHDSLSALMGASCFEPALWCSGGLCSQGGCAGVAVHA